MQNMGGGAGLKKGKEGRAGRKKLPPGQRREGVGKRQVMSRRVISMRSSISTVPTPKMAVSRRP